VLPDAPQGLKHHVAGDWQEWECEHEALVLPPYTAAKLVRINRTHATLGQQLSALASTVEMIFSDTGEYLTDRAKS
jgi:hypothetical protein